MSIVNYEDILEVLKNDYGVSLKKVISSIKSTDSSSENMASLREEFHHSGVKYFNKFERSLDEYSLPEMNITSDIAIRKAEDTMNFVETIINHWQLLNAFSTKYDLDKIQPSQTAYASMQRVIKKFYPNKVENIKKSFLAENLPTVGFDDYKKHSGWQKKFHIDKQLVIGVPTLLICGFLVFKFPKMTGFQYLFTRCLLGISTSMVLVSCVTGSMDMKLSFKDKLMLTATGGFVIFFILYFFNSPAPPNSIG